MGIRGFVVVLICAVVLGVVARSFDFSSSSGTRAAESAVASPSATSGGPRELDVRSAVGFTLPEIDVHEIDVHEIDVHEGERWRTVPLRDGTWTPAGAGPWRVRAAGHAEEHVARGPVTLEPDALVELVGSPEDLDALAAGFAERAVEAPFSVEPFERAERLSGRWLWAVRWAPCLPGSGLDALGLDADLAGGRRLRFAWEPAPGAHTRVELDTILTERRTAPLAVRVLGPDGEAVPGALVSLAPAGKAVRYRPRDLVLERNCLRIDVAPTPRPDRRSDADGLARFAGVGVGSSFAVGAWDPATGRWQLETLEHDGESATGVPVAVELANTGVVVTGRLVLPSELASELTGELPATADFQLVWRSVIEGVGTGLAVSANRAELRDRRIEPDGSFRLVTTGPRTPGEGSWKLTLDALVAGCAPSSVQSVSPLARDGAPEVDVGEVELEPIEPWILVADPRSALEEPARLDALGDPDGPQWWVRPVRSDEGLALQPIPAAEGGGFVARLASREGVTSLPEAVPERFVLRSDDRPERWFQRTEDGAFEEFATSSVRVDVHVAAAPAEGHPLAIELGGDRLELATLGREWVGETHRVRVAVPPGAHVVAGSSARVALDAPRVELVLR